MAHTGPTLRNLIQKFLPSLVAIALAAILAHFVFHAPPDVTGTVADLPKLFEGNWSFPQDAAMGLLTAVVMWFGAMGVGHLILYRGGATRCLPTLWTRWVFSPLVGWIVLSLLIFAFGIAGFAMRWALGTLMVLFAGAAIRGWGLLAAELRVGLEQEFENAETEEDLRAIESGLSETKSQPVLGGFRFTGLAFFLVVGLYLLVVPYALTPATESDELRYHLAAPAAWLQAGRIEYLPNQAFSNFPFMIEMLFMMAMSLQGTEGARLVHLTFLESCGILVALLGYLMVRVTSRRMMPAARESSLQMAGLAGLSFVLIPCATILGAWAFIDLAVAAYFLAVVYLGALALAGPIRPPAWLLGMMIGGALSTKYTMAPLMLAMLALMLLVGMWRGGGRVNFKYVFFAGLISLAVASPWFLKNVALTGNPFYPLAYELFGGNDWSDTNAAFYSAKAGEKGLRAAEMYKMAGERGVLISILREPGWDKIIEFVLSPITTSLFPDKFEEHFLAAIPLSGMLLAVAGLLTLLVRRRKGSPFRPEPTREKWALAFWIIGVIAGSWLFWFLTYQSNRMLLPTLGLILSAGCWGFARLADTHGTSPAPRAIRAIVLAGMLYAFLYTSCHLLGSQPREVTVLGRQWYVGSSRFQRPLRVAFGFEQPENYLAKRLEYYNAARELHRLIGEKERALLIGEHRTLWFDSGVIASDWFDTPQPLDLIRATRDNDELIERLRADGVRYIFFNRGELMRYAPLYFIPRFQPDEFARFESLIGFSTYRPNARLREIFQDVDDKTGRDIRIYEIMLPAASPSESQVNPSQNP